MPRIITTILSLFLITSYANAQSQANDAIRMLLDKDGTLEYMIADYCDPALSLFGAKSYEEKIVYEHVDGRESSEISYTRTDKGSWDFEEKSEYDYDSQGRISKERIYESEGNDFSEENVYSYSAYSATYRKYVIDSYSPYIGYKTTNEYEEFYSEDGLPQKIILKSRCLDEVGYPDESIVTYTYNGNVIEAKITGVLPINVRVTLTNIGEIVKAFFEVDFFSLGVYQPWSNNEYHFSDSASAIDVLTNIIKSPKTASQGVYSLGGKRINKPSAPGIYIINGKKTIIPVR